MHVIQAKENLVISHLAPTNNPWFEASVLPYMKKRAKSLCESSCEVE